MVLEIGFSYWFQRHVFQAKGYESLEVYGKVKLGYRLRFVLLNELINNEIRVYFAGEKGVIFREN